MIHLTWQFIRSIRGLVKNEPLEKWNMASDFVDLVLCYSVWLLPFHSVGSQGERGGLWPSHLLSMPVQGGSISRIVKDRNLLMENSSNRNCCLARRNWLVCWMCVNNWSAAPFLPSPLCLPFPWSCHPLVLLRRSQWLPLLCSCWHPHASSHMYRVWFKL